MAKQAILSAFENAQDFQPEPPMPLFRELSEAPSFPVDALGNLLGRAAMAIHDKTQAPVAICAQSVLAAATVVVQGYRDVILPTGQQKPLSNYFLTIASSGERKSACDALALEPVKVYESSLRLKHGQDYSQWEIEVEAWNKQKAQILSDKRYKSKSDKVIALQELGPSPIKPLTPLIISSEPTYQGMCKLLEHGMPSIGIFSDEGGQFIGSHGMKDENRLNTISNLSSVWDGSVIKRVLAGDGVTILPGRRVAIHLMVQPSVATGFLSDRMMLGQGFLSRFLVTFPASTMGNRFYREPKPESDFALRCYTDRLLAILNLPLPLAEGKQNELMTLPLQLSLEGKTLLLQFSDYMEGLLKPGGALDGLSGFANKLTEHATRLAAVIAMVEDMAQSVLTAQYVAMGIEIAQFYLQEALRLYDTGNTDPTLQEAKVLLTWLQTKWTEPAVSVADICKLGPHRIRDKYKAIPLVKILEEHRWLIRSAEPILIKGNRRQEAWYINKEQINA